jgi:type IV pilus assembly protein PilB
LLAVMSQRLVRTDLPALPRGRNRTAARPRDAFGVAPDETFHAGRGCDRCEGLGVYGRRAVYELMIVTPATARLDRPRRRSRR